MMKKIIKGLGVLAVVSCLALNSVGAFAAVFDGITYTKARSAGTLTNITDMDGQRQKAYTYSATTTHTSGTRPTRMTSNVFTGPNTGPIFASAVANPTTNNVSVTASKVANYSENVTPPAVSSTHVVVRGSSTVTYRL